MSVGTRRLASHRMPHLLALSKMAVRLRRTADRGTRYPRRPAATTWDPRRVGPGSGACSGRYWAGNESPPRGPHDQLVGQTDLRVRPGDDGARPHRRPHRLRVHRRRRRSPLRVANLAARPGGSHPAGRLGRARNLHGYTRWGPRTGLRHRVRRDPRGSARRVDPRPCRRRVQRLLRPDRHAHRGPAPRATELVTGIVVDPTSSTARWTGIGRAGAHSARCASTTASRSRTPTRPRPTRSPPHTSPGPSRRSIRICGPWTSSPSGRLARGTATRLRRLPRPAGP